MIDLQSWENSILGQHLDTDGLKADTNACSQVPLDWAVKNHPGIPWTELLPQVGSNQGVCKWAGQSTKHYTWIENNHADVNQLPAPGDIMVFGPTPLKDYSCTFKNPYGHAGVCKSASPSGYTLIQQNAPQDGEGVNDTSYPWHFRPCLGWFRMANQLAVVPVSAPVVAPVVSANVGRTLHLPASITAWHVYNVDGPYDLAHATHVLDPAKFNGLSYTIKRDLGNGIYVITTQDWGDVAIWTSNTVAIITG